jgi:hypothetical protein
MPAMKFGTHHRLRARYSRSWLIRDNESGRAHDFGESKLRGAVPPPAAVQVPGRGGRAGATSVLLTFAQKYDCRLDRDQKVNKRVARSHRIEFGKLL